MFNKLPGSSIGRNWQSDHRTWQQRGGYNGYRIPDTRFRGYFGPEHGFRIEGLPFMVVGGFPRFEYDGYWLSVVDPWPADWDSDWYDNDQVYVAYVDNGYYLYNRSYRASALRSASRCRRDGVRPRPVPHLVRPIVAT